VIAVAAVALLVVVGSGSSRLVGHSFPGFVVWDNGTIPSLHSSEWTGASAGLPRLGRVVAVDGRAFDGGSELLRHVDGLGPGQPVRYLVRSAAGEAFVEVPTMRLSWGSYLSTFGIYLGTAAVLFLVAVVAMLLRPDLTAARATAVAAGTLGLVLTLTVDFLSSYRLTPLYSVAEAVLPGALVYFALAFPAAPPSRPGRRGRRALAVLLVALLALGLVQAWLFRVDPDLHVRITGLIYLLLAAALVGVLASFGHQLLASRSPEARMQAGIVFAGAIASATPAAILLAAMFLLGWTFSITWVVIFVPFLPVSILYAVVYRDMLAAERFIRLTTGYALAAGAIAIGYTVVLFGLDRLALAGLTSEPIASLGFLLALWMAFDPLRGRVQRAIDRRFFRTTVETASVLEQSSTEFAVLGEEVAIKAHVSRLLQESLALDWADLSTAGPARADAMVVEPVEFRGKSLGLLCCGPKRSGAPFSAAELDLVSGLANQAALALQNARTLERLRAAQDDLVRQERFAAIGELSAAVAHGLRNPLAGIRAAAQVAHEVVHDKAAEGPLSDVLAEVDRLDTRVRTLLDFSRPFEPRLESVDLADHLRLISRGLATAARAKGVELELALPEEPAKTLVDPNLLEEVIQELAGNALRAVEAGGTLRLALAVVGETASIRVEDTGKGIPDAVQHRIFDPFFTTRAEGTGMGLPTVKKLIERQHGRVALEVSGPGRTVFRIDLPFDGARSA
jgi:signal transduction histidine kinase